MKDKENKNKYLVVSGAPHADILAECLNNSDDECRKSLDGTLRIVKTAPGQNFGQAVSNRDEIHAGPFNHKQMKQYLKDNIAEWEPPE